ncbi:MAG: pilin [Patescibacteria group bacterium]|nr:pilin [Patescibacteria group bacterium]
MSETSGLNAAARRTTLIQGANLFTIVAGVINGLLSLLGMLFTVLVIYGGFKWMLARGNSQQVDEAKKVISNAAIGLAIVVLSYVIVYAVLQVLEGGLGQSGPPAEGGGG